MDTPVVLITGALTGIGRTTALAFAREGRPESWCRDAATILAGRSPPNCGPSRAEGGTEAEFVRADVRHEDDVSNLVVRAVERFGRLDVAVNNAGTEGKSGAIAEVSVEDYVATFETNVLGTLLSMKHEMRVMLAQRHGSIVNLSSTMGSRGAANASLYVASKHAVEGLTKSGALEGAAFGVRVNAVAPGPIETDMLSRFTGTAERMAGAIAGVPAKRIGKPEEIAQTILFLASEKANFLAGQIIGVNGGKTAL